MLGNLNLSLIREKTQNFQKGTSPSKRSLI